MTGRLLAIRERATEALRRNADVLYRHSATWSDGSSCRFSVKDAARVKPDEVARLSAFAGSNGLLFQDLRVLTVHPDDVPPGEGASLNWDGGTLEVLSWSQVSDFTGQAKGTCVLRR